MTAKPVPEHISDERLAVRPTQDITTRLDNLAQSLAGEYPPHTLMDLAEAASLITTLRAALTELQHRREAEAEPVFDDPYIGPFTGPLSAGQAIRWQVKCSNIADEWFTDEGSADQWANSPGHYDAEIVVWTASPSSPASGVRVKALDWRQSFDGMTRADTIVGRYEIWTYHEAGEWFWKREGSLTRAVADEAAAKAECQSDYDAKVLSALGEHP